MSWNLLSRIRILDVGSTPQMLDMATLQPIAHRTHSIFLRIGDSSMEVVVRKSRKWSTKGWDWRRWADSHGLGHIMDHWWRLWSILTLVAWGRRAIIIPSFTLFAARLEIVTVTTLSTSITEASTTATTSANSYFGVRVI